MNTIQLKQQTGRLRRHHQSGMTLIEVVVALVLAGMAVGGIITGYAFCTASAEKASLALAANARAMERIEEIRSAKWDLSSWPTIDQLVATNFPKKVVTLDQSGSGMGTTSATILTEILQVSTNPPLKSIRVNCIWEFKGDNITNTIETCRAPDQ
jgi:prepilin-type N-terminal cleavage/methylation domain-containing protein